MDIREICTEKLITFLRSHGQKILEEIGLESIKKIFNSVRSKMGRDIEYSREKIFELVCEAISAGATNASSIARYAKNKLIRLRYWITKSPSHDVISDFFKELSNVAEDLFYFLVRRASDMGIIKPYASKAIDTYPIETRYWSDPDAQWNPRPKSQHKTKGKWYWGYGGLVIFDVETHLPCGGRLTYSKKVDGYECMEATGNAQENAKFDVLTADSEFDIESFRVYCESIGIMLIAQYNPRRDEPKKPIKYRIQTNDMSQFEWIDKEYSQRIEVEHSGSTIKEHLPLDYPMIKGYQKVKMWFFLMLSIRLIRGIAAVMAGKNPRCIVDILDSVDE